MATIPKKRTAQKSLLKLWLIPEIYGWLIVLIGIGFILILVPTAFGNLYYNGITVENLFGSVMLVVEGFGVGGGFIAFGTALRRIIIVQATLCVILLLITIWFLYIFSVFSDWENCLISLGIGLIITFPLAFCVFANREKI